MNKLKQLSIWVLRAWPFLMVGMLAACHYILLSILTIGGNHINKIIGAVLQVVGGLIVLYTLNENIGLFRGQTLFSMVVGYFRDFPLIRRHTTLHVQSLKSTVSMSGSVTAHLKRKCGTIEEQLEELQRQIDECRQLVHDREKEIRILIDKAKQELKSAISENTDKISGVNNLLTSTVVGGIKTQVFGVLLVAYGAFVNVF